MSLTTLAPMPVYREFTGAGAPLAGGQLYTAQPGTVAGPAQSFPKSTYTDANSMVLNTNPVVLDSAGRANVYLLGAYSMALYDAAGVLIWSNSNVFSNASGGGAGAGAATSFIFGDATSAAFNVSILSANDPTAPDVYEISKLDSSANPVHVTSITGTVDGAAFLDLTNQKESVRLKKYALTNDWMRG
jgi:hypothetical protein